MIITIPQKQDKNLYIIIDGYGCNIGIGTNGAAKQYNNINQMQNDCKFNRFKLPLQCEHMMQKLYRS